MFRIRRVLDDNLARDQRTLMQVQDLMRLHFPAMQEKDVTQLPEQLKNPLRYRFRSILFVAENTQRRLKGFALLLHAPDLAFCYLDFIAVDQRRMGAGVGGALYQEVRRESLALGAIGVFLECLPDDLELCRDPDLLEDNRARLKFYEYYGVRPVIHTEYETPFKPSDDCPPYLLYDGLGRSEPLPQKRARAIVRAILERKYGKSCPPGYIYRVVHSFRDDPVRLRSPQYVKTKTAAQTITQPVGSIVGRMALVVHDGHTIHHVRERGYVESPVRISHILAGIEKSILFDRIAPKHFPESWIREAHHGPFVDYLKRMCLHLEPGKAVYPYVFPIRNATRPPKELPIRAGYYCIDTFTPLTRNAFIAAKRAVDCALTAAKAASEGYQWAYALVRPPGHHAERAAFGGFCYFNSTSIAANFLSVEGRVAILDLDYHHGNGTQNIFYHRADVLTLSLHGHPKFAYPYFTGFADERGSGVGDGFNGNYPLPENLDGEGHRQALTKALGRVRRFQPKFLVVALGLDTARGDPTGSWSLTPKDFERMGAMVGALRLPTVLVQEGGYRIRTLGTNAGRFFAGLLKGANESDGRIRRKQS